MEHPPTYQTDGKSITCLLCHHTSYHPEDVANLYCGFCHIFHQKQDADPSVV